LSYPEFFSDIIICNWYPAPEQAQHRIAFWIDLLISLAQQFDPAIHQQRTKHVDDPMKPLNQTHARHNEEATRDECPQDAPEQHPVLQVVWNSKETKNHQEDEKIIDTEGKLDQIPGSKLQTRSTAVPEINEHTEGERQTDPHRAPAQRLAKADAVCPAIKHTKVEHKHHNYK